MRPILFEIFGWEVPSWHLFFILAAFTAWLVAAHCARLLLRRGVAHAERFLDVLPQIFVICYTTSWFGARALSILVEQLDVQTPSEFLKALFSIGPMTFYGGALAAVCCGVFYCRWKHVSLRLALDCGVVGGVFALGVGRIGCFLNGDDYGAAIANQSVPPWWSVRFVGLEDGGLYRYPVQLEETLASVLIGCAGLWLLNRARVSGRTAAWVALLSAAHRFFNEAFRGDPRGFFPGTQISTSSGIAVLIVVFCAICLARMRNRTDEF
ncbi:hypothetical protein EBU99_03965 [bacterium]|nr:hypothetical protein [bacterium]